MRREEAGCVNLQACLPKIGWSPLASAVHALFSSIHSQQACVLTVFILHFTVTVLVQQQAKRAEGSHGLEMQSRNKPSKLLFAGLIIAEVCFLSDSWVPTLHHLLMGPCSRLNLSVASKWGQLHCKSLPEKSGHVRMLVVEFKSQLDSRDPRASDLWLVLCVS